MVANECPSREELLQATIGTLRESATRRIEQHLETCLDCLHAVQNMGRDDKLIELFRAAAVAR